MRPVHYLGLCAIAKDETPFLREWVAYHHYIGFEKIYIYDNESVVPVRDTVRDFFKQGICETYTIQGERRQLTAYNHCLLEHGSDFEWMAFFDLDEFLCLKTDSDARVMLRDYEQYSGLSLNWDVFSSSGHLRQPAGSVMENNTQSLGYDFVCKCIVRPSRVTYPLSPHHFLFREGIAVNASCIPALGGYIPLSTDDVCLNHYQYRSQQDFEIKMNRADATRGFNPRSLEEFRSQAARPWTERGDILRLAREIPDAPVDGFWPRRQDVTMSQLDQESLASIMVYIAKAIRYRKLDMAEVLFSLAYRDNRTEEAFMELGVELFTHSRKSKRALILAGERLALNPDAAGHMLMLETLVQAGKRKEAEETFRFLQFAMYFEENTHLRNTILPRLEACRKKLDQE